MKEITSGGSIFYFIFCFAFDRGRSGRRTVPPPHNANVATTKIRRRTNVSEESPPPPPWIRHELRDMSIKINNLPQARGKLFTPPGVSSCTFYDGTFSTVWSGQTMVQVYMCMSAGICRCIRVSLCLCVCLFVCLYVVCTNWKRCSFFAIPLFFKNSYLRFCTY